MVNHKIIVTGGCGFIGSNFIRNLSQNENIQILNIDNLSYAGNLETTNDFSSQKNYKFINGSVTDSELVSKIFREFNPTSLINFAAETHVDRSIDKSDNFIKTNIFGTYNLLENSRIYLKNNRGIDFKFVHISTDEVFGSLSDGKKFNEETSYDPSSPYSASKASSDHLVKAWFRTYNVPIVITNCSNNYGPFQFPEKLIPITILNALMDRNIRVYGNGLQIRDWLHVNDHVEALKLVIQKGKIGETYNIGGECEYTNIKIVNKICESLDKIRPNMEKKSYKELIQFVEDRPGHDKRYAIDISKIKKELNWTPKVTLDIGLENTINWYLLNQNWCENVTKNKYGFQRLGTI